MRTRPAPAASSSRHCFVLLLGIMAFNGCSTAPPMAPEEMEVTSLLAPGTAVLQASASPNSCWGQATQVFARMGVMGEHASQHETPRIGLRNLARALYEAGAIREDSMQALGAYVAEALGLSIEACL